MSLMQQLPDTKWRLAAACGFSTTIGCLGQVTKSPPRLAIGQRRSGGTRDYHRPQGGEVAVKQLFCSQSKWLARLAILYTPLPRKRSTPSFGSSGYITRLIEEWFSFCDVAGSNQRSG
ncbi:hypothetical protein RRG08_026197 [Elysia crispata]|uniref:Uncharacterized protein n=1 Tax=Elysia crispata TaxID=231223 RepID=A0AAE0ZA88_9GAST|nr:hypothetical protein RRG08_026197 [Elysia crispata]